MNNTIQYKPTISKFHVSVKAEFEAKSVDVVFILFT